MLEMLDSRNIVLNYRAELMQTALEEFKCNSYVYTLPLLDTYRKLLGENVTQNNLKTFTISLDKYLSAHGLNSYHESTKLGKLFYDGSVHSADGIKHVYRVVVNNYKLNKENASLKEKDTLTPQSIHDMLKEQCTHFPKSSVFDYRTLIRDGCLDDDKIANVFDSKLVTLIDSITTSTCSKYATHSKLYSDMKKVRSYPYYALH